MLKVNTTTEFDKAFKRIKKQNKDVNKLLDVARKIANGEKLAEKYRDHKLTGYKISDCRECHIEPDWLLIYKIYNDELILLLVTTGSYSILFK